MFVHLEFNLRYKLRINYFFMQTKNLLFSIKLRVLRNILNLNSYKLGVQWIMCPTKSGGYLNFGKTAFKTG